MRYSGKQDMVDLSLSCLTRAPQVLCILRCSEGPSAVIQALSPVLLFVAGAAAFMACLKTIPLALPALVVLVATQVVRPS